MRLSENEFSFWKFRLERHILRKADRNYNGYFYTCALINKMFSETFHSSQIPVTRIQLGSALMGRTIQSERVSRHHCCGSLTAALRLTLGFFMVVAMLACSPALKYQLKFNPDQQLRVAVMPFAQVNDKGEIIPGNELMPPTSNLLIDKVSLVSSTPRETPTRFVRTLVQNGIRATQLEMIDPALIEIELPHHGFGTEDGTFDVAKIRSTNASEICTRYIECDAILYGTIHRWERNYYGIQSVNSVDLELELKSAKDNSVIYHARLKDSDSRGIIGGPTGISDLVLEPIRGLDSEIIEDLARSVVNRMLAPLNPHQTAKKGSGLPSIYAATHNAQIPLKTKAQFDVLLFGSPEGLASFRIGSSTGDIPLIERSPGHYSGKYFVQPYEHFESQPMFVKIQGPSGLTTEQVVLGASFSKP